MPFNFSGQSHQSVARLGVVSDGAVFTTDGYGETVTSSLPARSAFAAVPTRSATGVWSVTMKDAASGGVICVDVKTLLTSGNYLSTQLLPTTTVSLTGQLVLHWVFNDAGTPTDLPADGQFQVYVVYSETSGQ